MSGDLSSIISTSDMNACRIEEESDSNSAEVSCIISSIVTELLSSDFESEELWDGHDRHLEFLGSGLPSLLLACKQSLVACP